MASYSIGPAEPPSRQGNVAKVQGFRPMVSALGDALEAKNRLDKKMEKKLILPNSPQQGNYYCARRQPWQGLQVWLLTTGTTVRC